MRFWRRRKTIKEEERKTIKEEERKTVQAGVEEDCFVRGGKEACKGRRKDQKGIPGGGRNTRKGRGAGEAGLLWNEGNLSREQSVI